MKIYYNDYVQSFSGKPSVSAIQNIVIAFKTRGQLKGLGGELLKQACALLIKKCALVHFPVHSTSTVDEWQNLLEECLSHEVAAVRLRAAEAHTAFFNEYYTEATNSKERRNNLVDRYLDQLRSNNKTVRIGFAQAIGIAV